MYIETYLIPTNKDEWIINLHLGDGTKIQTRIAYSYKKAVQMTSNWARELDNCPYSIGDLKFNDGSEKV